MCIETTFVCIVIECFIYNVYNVNAFRNGQCEVFAVVPSASEGFFDCYFQSFVIAVVCDTFVVNANAAVDYRYVFVFINGHNYCVVNNFSNFYRYCVATCSIYFDCSCGTSFSRCSFNIQTLNCHDVGSFDAATNFDDDFIVIIFNAGFDSRFFEFDRVACAVCEFETAVQFQFEFIRFCIVSESCCKSVTYSGFNFDVFDCSNFFCSDINCVFNGSFDTSCFYGSDYQIIAVCYCSIVGINGYCSCFTFGCFIHYDTSIVTIGNFDSQNIASADFLTVISTDCYFEFVFVNVNYFGINRSFAIQSQCCTNIVSFAVFVSVCDFSVIQCECEFQSRTACCCISCCECQLNFRTCNFTVCFFNFILCVVFSINYFSCCFEVAGSCKCCCRNQRYDHSRSHYHGKKFFHGFIPPFKILFFVLCSFYNYTTKRISLCASAASAARLKQLLWVRQSPLPIP